ncbi:MAG: AMP-binding protein [Leptospiraceae bacterium]|nr:AMP-binding protein [Leptospiraceae bacterium]
MEYKNLAHFFEKISERYAKLNAFAVREKDGSYQYHTYAKTRDTAFALAAALIELGIKPGDHVGIFADNRYEWILCDMAIIFCGAADVPRGSDVTDDDISYIVPHSEMKLIIVENETILKKIKNVLPSHPQIICMQATNEENTLSLTSIIDHGRELIKFGLGTGKVRRTINAIKPDDLFTLIYTSGTTGTPKGVMLTHGNIISQINNIPLTLERGSRILSILPIWHIFERTFEMVSLANGACTYYSSIKTLRDDLRAVKPQFMASAPRLWESIYSGIITNVGKSSAVKQIMFHSAVQLSEWFFTAIRNLTGKELKITSDNPLTSIVLLPLNLAIAILLFIPWKLMDTIVLAKIRAATGGELQGTVSGGGALPLHVDRFFNNIGIPVLEGYGLTETSPVISVRTFDNLVIGTVGPLYNQTELRIINLENGEEIWPAQKKYGVKGEIHVRGPQIMKGYFKSKEKTNAVLKDGWLNTGDLGVMTQNHCLKIVGRSKETIVLLNGENVEPVPIENKLQESSLIEQCMVVGQDQKSLGVLIVPSVTAREQFTKIEDLRASIGKEIRSLVSTGNGFKAFEKIGNFAILEKPFEVGDELTPKLSLKRHTITEKYTRIIELLYQ